GNTLHNISYGPSAAFVRRSITKLLIDPRQSPAGFPRLMYAAVTGGAAEGRGIYKSFDGGGTWTIITGDGVDGMGNPNQIGDDIRVTDLEYVREPNGQFSLFAGVRGGRTAGAIAIYV